MRPLFTPLAILTITPFLVGARLGAAAPYVELAAEDFVIVSAVGERRTREIARQLTMFRAAMEATFGMRAHLAAPTRIHALSAADWQRVAPERTDVAGYSVTQAFAGDLLFDAESAEPGTFELLFHEYTHHLLRSLGTRRYPAFFDEGLAEVFSTATFARDRVRFRPRAEHLALLRRHEWIPFERLLAIERHDGEYLDHALAPAFYAQAWATMYYAVASSSTFGNRLLDYVRDVNSGVPDEAAAEGLLGDSAYVNREIVRFTRNQNRLPRAELRIGGAADVRTVALRTLSDAERDLALGELLLRMGKRGDAALAVIRDAGGTEADRVRARVGEGLVHLQAGDIAAAREALDGVAPAADLSPECAVMLGHGLFQLSVSAAHLGEPAEQEQARLRRARGLYASALPDHRTWVEATHGYVLASLALHERDASLLALARKAYTAAPRNAELAVSIAILLELDGNKTLARRYWTDAVRHQQEGPGRTRILRHLGSNAEGGAALSYE